MKEPHAEDLYQLAERRQQLQQAKCAMFKLGTEQSIYDFKVAQIAADFTAHLIKLRTGQKL